MLPRSTAVEVQLLEPLRGDRRITAGATPHHLFFSEEALGGLADPRQTRPPIRPEHDRRALWTAMKRGRLDCVSSAHEAGPGPGGGVPGAELLLPLLLSAVKFGRLSLENVASLCSEAPARIFGLERKGRVEVGADADLVLFAEGELIKVASDRLTSPAGWSPYIDHTAAAKPEAVISGGQVVARRGEVVAERPPGRFLTR
jgi:dihydroorotase